jgi:hypothetical protein
MKQHWLVLALVLLSCERPPASGVRATAVRVRHIQTNVSVPAMTDTAQKTCGVQNTPVLSDDGIGHFRVRAAAADVRTACNVIRDTLLELGAEGLPERRMSVLLGADTVVATINDGFVWRIEVRSARLRTADGLGVGSPVAKLRDQPHEYLGYGEGGPFVKVKSHCGLSFELGGFGNFAKTIDQVPATATVDEVLVLGCR